MASSDKLGTSVEQLPVAALEAVGRIFAEGESKYGVGNWKDNPTPDYRMERLRHAIIHLQKFANFDTTEDHLAKVLWFCCTELHLQSISKPLREYSMKELYPNAKHKGVPIGVCPISGKVIHDNEVKIGSSSKDKTFEFPTTPPVAFYKDKGTDKLERELTYEDKIGMPADIGKVADPKDSGTTMGYDVASGPSKSAMHMFEPTTMQGTSMPDPYLSSKLEGSLSPEKREALQSGTWDTPTKSPKECLENARKYLDNHIGLEQATRTQAQVEELMYQLFTKLDGKYQEEMNILREVIEEKNQLISKHEKELKLLGEDAAQACAEAVKRGKKIDSLHEQLKQERSEHRITKTDLRTLKEENKSLRSQVNRFNHEDRKLRNQFQTEYDKLKKEKDEFQKHYEIALRERSTYLECYNKSEQKLLSVQLDNQSIRDKNNSLRCELHDTTTKFNGLKTRFDNLAFQHQLLLNNYNVIQKILNDNAARSNG